MQGGAQAAGPHMMMPFFMGGPWLQKFNGEGSEIKLGEWKQQVTTMINLQPISDSQKADFVLGLLDGEAKREILTLEKACRDTPQKIFDVLTALYGDNVHVSTLRTQFFNCRQGPQQTLRSFSLCLRELFSRLKQREDVALGEGDILLRDQFIMGLREGPIRQELRRQVRNKPRLSFDEAKMEAMALEEELDEQWLPTTCLAMHKQVPHAASPAMDWKKELRNEILQEVKEHVSEMTKTILAELKDNVKPTTYTPPLPLSDTHIRNPNRHGYRARAGPSKNRWDSQGRPICNHCNEPGHFSRNCSSRPTSQGF